MARRRQKFLGAVQTVSIGNSRSVRRWIRNASPMRFSIDTAVKNLMGYIVLIEVPAESAAKNLGYTQQLQKATLETLEGSELYGILATTSTRWKLWRVEFYEDYFVLSYNDAADSKRATGLRIRITWPENTLHFFVDDHRDIDESTPYEADITYRRHDVRGTKSATRNLGIKMRSLTKEETVSLNIAAKNLP